jgi:hypothetical protein
MSMRHRSVISGSRAAFSRMQVPLAVLAAISAFSVAPTETTGKTYLPPGRPPSGAEAFT